MINRPINFMSTTSRFFEARAQRAYRVYEYGLQCRMYVITRRNRLSVSEALSLNHLDELRKEDMLMVKRCCMRRHLPSLIINNKFNTITCKSHPLDTMFECARDNDDDIAILYDQKKNKVLVYDPKAEELVMEEYL